MFFLFLIFFSGYIFVSCVHYYCLPIAFYCAWLFFSYYIFFSHMNYFCLPIASLSGALFFVRAKIAVGCTRVQLVVRLPFSTFFSCDYCVRRTWDLIRIITWWVGGIVCGSNLGSEFRYTKQQLAYPPKQSFQVYPRRGEEGCLVYLYFLRPWMIFLRLNDFLQTLAFPPTWMIFLRL